MLGEGRGDCLRQAGLRRGSLARQSSQSMSPRVSEQPCLKESELDLVALGMQRSTE